MQVKPAESESRSGKIYCSIQPVRLLPADFHLATLANKLSYHHKSIRLKISKLSNGNCRKNLVSILDVFLIQLTGLGKCLIFQAAPMVFDVVKWTKFQSIAVVFH